MSKQEPQPFHSGEIFYLWTYLHRTKEYLVTIQVLRNHTEDEDLKVYLDDIVESCFTENAQQVEDILKDAGVRLPPSPPDRPNVELADIPAGARFNDPEIYRMVQKELGYRMDLCSSIISITNQEVVKELFNGFHAQKLEHDIKLSKIGIEKGWYVPPPINIK